MGSAENPEEVFVHILLTACTFLSYIEASSLLVVDTLVSTCCVLVINRSYLDIIELVLHLGLVLSSNVSIEGLPSCFLVSMEEESGLSRSFFQAGSPLLLHFFLCS